MTATAAGTAADGPPARARKKRGSNGYPRGVQETTSGKFQARVNYKPPDQKQGHLRGIGTFDTAEEAGQAVVAAEAKLKAEGIEAVWPVQARTNRHKRGEVRQSRKHHTARLLTHFPPAHLQAPPPERQTSRRWGMYNSQKSAKLHLSPQDFEAWKAERGAPAGAETEPSFGLMPTCPAAIVNDGMRAFLAPDRSGEVSPAASAE